MKVKLPDNVIQFLVDLPEHGQGYQNVMIETDDGLEHKTVVYNSEWLELPKGYRIENVKSVQYI